MCTGIDLEAGGTWLGVTEGGRFGVLTNFRSPIDDQASALAKTRKAMGVKRALGLIIAGSSAGAMTM